MRPNRSFLVGVFAAVLLLHETNSLAMGLRAFVALPLEEGGTVARPLVERDNDAGVTRLTTELAYGLTGKQTLFLALPYRLSSGAGDRTGDLSALYRLTVLSRDERDGTTRLSLLGGAVFPTGSSPGARVQGGAVVTVFRDRQEWDADFLWVDRSGGTPASARYDLSWQYRLNSVGTSNPWSEVWWMSVVELGGRWREGTNTTQQLTLGLQRIAGRWVVEGGVVRDLNSPHDTGYLLSVRLHF